MGSSALAGAVVGDGYGFAAVAPLSEVLVCVVGRAESYDASPEAATTAALSITAHKAGNREMSERPNWFQKCHQGSGKIRN
jgi:hypothetical protein